MLSKHVMYVYCCCNSIKIQVNIHMQTTWVSTELHTCSKGKQKAPRATGESIISASRFKSYSLFAGQPQPGQIGQDFKK